MPNRLPFIIVDRRGLPLWDRRRHTSAPMKHHRLMPQHKSGLFSNMTKMATREPRCTYDCLHRNLVGLSRKNLEGTPPFRSRAETSRRELCERLTPSSPTFIRRSLRSEPARMGVRPHRRKDEKARLRQSLPNYVRRVVSNYADETQSREPRAAGRILRGPLRYRGMQTSFLQGSIMQLRKIRGQLYPAHLQAWESEGATPSEVQNRAKLRRVAR